MLHPIQQRKRRVARYGRGPELLSAHLVWARCNERCSRWGVLGGCVMSPHDLTTYLPTLLLLSCIRMLDIKICPMHPFTTSKSSAAHATQANHQRLRDFGRREFTERATSRKTSLHWLLFAAGIGQNSGRLLHWRNRATQHEGERAHNHNAIDALIVEYNTWVAVSSTDTRRPLRSAKISERKIAVLRVSGSDRLLSMNLIQPSSRPSYSTRIHP